MNYRLLTIVFLSSWFTIMMTSCSHVGYNAYKDQNSKRSSTSQRAATKRSYVKHTSTKPAYRGTNHDASPSGLSTDITRNRVIAEAQKHLGKPYKYGGKGPSGFDCSGFTTYVMQVNDVNVSGPSHVQSALGELKPIDQLEPGDLAIFGLHEKVTHVGLVKSRKEDEIIVIHATSKGGVREDNIMASDYWRKRLKYGRDVISHLDNTN